MEDEPLSKSMSSSMPNALVRFWEDGSYEQGGEELDWVIKGIS